VSYTHHILETRVITDSGWDVNVEEGPRNETRWFYPHANGTYEGTIQRFGLQVRTHFGKKADAPEAPVEDDAFEPEPRDAEPLEKPQMPDDPEDLEWTKPPSSPGPTAPPPE
jgi:hypothetical protein